MVRFVDWRMEWTGWNLHILDLGDCVYIWCFLWMEWSFVMICYWLLVNKTNRCTEFQFYWYWLHPTPGSIRSSQLHKMYQSRCTAKNTWWWAERLPETWFVIPIKLEFTASVGFIHKESVMHGHIIVKIFYWICNVAWWECLTAFHFILVFLLPFWLLWD
jgi:hypothetical protein